ncbi:MAG: hypothetical protein CL672_08285 [Balneola sp.]|nr:hypothetical protein [Balneola sp.]|tara:strand:+ start:409 stop:852 length:444 start_codon:yes stop_codon:yes gene_type:complete
MKNSPPNFFKSLPKSSKYLRYISFLGIGVMTLWLLMVLNMDSNLGSSTSSESGKSNVGIYITFIGIVSSLVFIYWLSLKKDKMGIKEVSNSNIKLLETVDIDNFNQLILLEVNEEIWILSASQTNLNLLSKYSKTEWKSDLDNESLN